MDKSQKEELREFLRITNALYDSMKTTLNVAPNELWNCAGYWQYIRKYNQIIDLISKTMSIDTAIDRYDLDKIPSPGNATVMLQKEFIVCK